MANGHFQQGRTYGRSEDRGRLEAWIKDELAGYPEFVAFLDQLTPEGISPDPWVEWLDGAAIEARRVPRKVGAPRTSNPVALNDKRATISKLQARRANYVRKLEEIDRDIQREEAIAKAVLTHGLLRAIALHMKGNFSMGAAWTVMRAVNLPEYEPDKSSPQYKQLGENYRRWKVVLPERHTQDMILRVLQTLRNDYGFISRIHELLFELCAEFEERAEEVIEEHTRLAHTKSAKDAANIGTAHADPSVDASNRDPNEDDLEPF
jgi:hypothetical protein